MNYKRAQLAAMPTLGGGPGNSALKVDGPNKRVWLTTFVSSTIGYRYEVVVETKQDGKWLVTERYPAE